MEAGVTVRRRRRALSGQKLEAPVAAAMLLAADAADAEHPLSLSLSLSSPRR